MTNWAEIGVKFSWMRLARHIQDTGTIPNLNSHVRTGFDDPNEA